MRQLRVPDQGISLSGVELDQLEAGVAAGACNDPEIVVRSYPGVEIKRCVGSDGVSTLVVNQRTGAFAHVLERGPYAKIVVQGVGEECRRIAMHGLRRALLEKQRADRHRRRLESGPDDGSDVWIENDAPGRFRFQVKAGKPFMQRMLVAELRTL